MSVQMNSATMTLGQGALTWSSERGLKHRRAHSDMVKEVSSYILEDLSCHYKVGDLAKQWGYSTDHFSRLFKETMGETPERYMINQRIQHSLALLKESALTVASISRLMGYKDSEHFSKQFKKVMGRPPRDFRARL